MRSPAGLTAAAVVFGFIRSLVIFHSLVKSAQTLHNGMFGAVLRTHVRFFDVNPIGESGSAIAVPKKTKKAPLSF